MTEVRKFRIEGFRYSELDVDELNELHKHNNCGEAANQQPQ